jgi:hypothetical protein
MRVGEKWQYLLLEPHFDRPVGSSACRPIRIDDPLRAIRRLEKLFLTDNVLPEAGEIALE